MNPELLRLITLLTQDALKTRSHLESLDVQTALIREKLHSHGEDIVRCLERLNYAHGEDPCKPSECRDDRIAELQAEIEVQRKMVKHVQDNLVVAVDAKRRSDAKCDELKAKVEALAITESELNMKLRNADADNEYLRVRLAAGRDEGLKIIDSKDELKAEINSLLAENAQLRKAAIR